MNYIPGEAALIDVALAAIGMVLARMDGAPPLPSHAPLSMAGALAIPNAPTAMPAKPGPDPELTAGLSAEHRAILCCLSSASALLGVSQTLIRQPASPTPMERLRQWDELIAQTKTAGRAAYRAALMLTDEHAG